MLEKMTQAMCLFYRPYMVDALNKRHKLYSKNDTSYARKKTQIMCLFYRPYMVDALKKRHKLCSKNDTSYVFFIDHVWSMLSIKDTSYT